MQLIRSARICLLAGLIAGTLDIGSAALLYHASPAVVMQAIAGGILGSESFRGGAGSAAIGLLLQWLMSWLIAAIYFTAARHVPWLLRRWILGGAFYGVSVFLVMHYVVVPLSASAPQPPLTLGPLAANLAAMWLFAGVIAWIAHRADLRSTESRAAGPSEHV